MTDKCDHIPHPNEVMAGIPHWNDRDDYKGQRWDIVSAWASQKMHYLGQLTKTWEGISLGEEKNYWLCNAWPNLMPAASGAPRVGRLPRDHPGWRTLRQVFRINSIPEFSMHLFNKHDGEVRVVRYSGWARVQQNC
eukprot:3916749-Pyramimonas_sp.AAC.1